MVELYKNKFNDSFNIEIDGIPMFAEDVSSEESYNRRETNRVNILGGTQFVQRTNYIVRKFSFTTHLTCTPDRPDMYDKILADLCSKPCEVISPDMGGMFDAEIQIKKDHTGPRTLTLNITVTEIPKVESNIPNDSFTIPEDKLESEEARIARESKTKTDT